jgi:hypothetical protein
MTEYDQEEERQARELMEYLSGKAPAEAEEELAALSEFSETLPWEQIEPDAVFQDQLQQELLRKTIAQEERRALPWQRFDLSGLAQLAMILILIAAVIIAVLAMMGPRIAEIFGTVYNTLSDGGTEYSLASIASAPIAIGSFLLET